MAPNNTMQPCFVPLLLQKAQGGQQKAPQVWWEGLAPGMQTLDLCHDAAAEEPRAEMNPEFYGTLNNDTCTAKPTYGNR